MDERPEIKNLSMTSQTISSPQLLDRVLNPGRSIARARSAKERLKRRLFYWTKGAHAGQLSDLTSEELELATPSERLKLASILLEAGEISAALQQAVAAYTSDPSLIQRERYVHLSVLLSEHAPTLVCTISQELRVIRPFLKRVSTFESMCAEAKDSICVVGNSPELLTRTDGEYIDSHDLVIRFNNYSTLPRVRLSTGYKTDMWARTLGYKWVWRRDDSSHFHMIVPGEAALYRRMNAHDAILDAERLGQKLEFIPAEIYQGLRVEYGVMAPSLGLLILYWLYAFFGELTGITTVGFKFTDQAAGGSCHYFKQPHPSPRNPHNWQLEAHVYREMHAVRAGARPLISESVVT